MNLGFFYSHYQPSSMISLKCELQITKANKQTKKLTPSVVENQVVHQREREIGAGGMGKSFILVDRWF